MNSLPDEILCEIYQFMFFAAINSIVAEIDFYEERFRPVFDAALKDHIYNFNSVCRRWNLIYKEFCGGGRMYNQLIKEMKGRDYCEFKPGLVEFGGEKAKGFDIKYFKAEYLADTKQIDGIGRYGISSKYNLLFAKYEFLVDPDKIKIILKPRSVTYIGGLKILLQKVGYPSGVTYFIKIKNGVEEYDSSGRYEFNDEKLSSYYLSTDAERYLLPWNRPHENLYIDKMLNDVLPRLNSYEEKWDKGDFKIDNKKPLKILRSVIEILIAKNKILI